MPATIKDIAKKLNVSVSTVSYALNGGPRTVPPDVRERVLQVAKDLDYRPNRLARSLVTRRSHTLGVVPTEPSINLALTPYFQGVLNGVLNESESLDQDVLIFTRFNPAEPDRLVDDLLDGRVDGVLFFAPLLKNPVIDRLADRKVPYVGLSTHIANAPVYNVDNLAGVRAAIGHLVGLGHRRIAHIHGKLSIDDGIERRDAYMSLMSGLGLEVLPGYLVDGDFTMDGGYRAAKALLSLPQRPTAIFCANDEIASGVVRAANERGLRLPQDLSIVGFDNAPISGITFPGLTTIRQPWEEMGQAAVRGLLDLIEGRTPESRRFDTELIVRASTTRPQEDNHK